MEKLKFRKLFVAFFYISFLIINYSGCGKETNSNIGPIIDEKLDKICDVKNLKVAASSNPYDYTKNNKDFEDIVKLGDDALQYMLEKFKNSKENGLKEYVMAIACSKILKENTQNKNWSTGKEWYNNYIEQNK